MISGFRVDFGNGSFNGPNIPNDLYTNVVMNNVEFDTTGGYNNTTGIWTAPAAGLLSTMGQCWVAGALPADLTEVVKVIKNGGAAGGGKDLFAGIGSVATIAGYPAIQFGGVDQVSEGDEIQLILYTDVASGQTASLNTNRAHTNWSLMFMPSGT